MRDVKIISLPRPKFEPHESRYRLIAPYNFIIELSGYERVFQIPAGFETDGGSVPRFGWRVAGEPFDPRYIASFLVHDWLYTVHALERDAADAVLYHAMRKEGASWVKARMYYRAVRWFGGSHW